MFENLDKELVLVLQRFAIDESLKKAIDRGELIMDEAGYFMLPEPDESIASPWMHAWKKKHFDCTFLMAFLFKQAYQKKRVPLGCQNCYKVSVKFKTFKQLMAFDKVQKEIECNSKRGIEVDRIITQNLYSGFFYCIGLDEARQIYQKVRALLDQDKDLGDQVETRIKRGCTEYEMHCGPSDQFRFEPELELIEQYLQTRFKRIALNKNENMEKMATYALWIETAYRIGDDSYLEFTQGKRLYPACVSYAPVD